MTRDSLLFILIGAIIGFLLCLNTCTSKRKPGSRKTYYQQDTFWATDTLTITPQPIVRTVMVPQQFTVHDTILLPGDTMMLARTHTLHDTDSISTHEFSISVTGTLDSFRYAYQVQPQLVRVPVITRTAVPQFWRLYGTAEADPMTGSIYLGGIAAGDRWLVSMAYGWPGKSLKAGMGLRLLRIRKKKP